MIPLQPMLPQDKDGKRQELPSSQISPGYRSSYGVRQAAHVDDAGRSGGGSHNSSGGDPSFSSGLSLPDLIRISQSPDLVRRFRDVRRADLLPFLFKLGGAP